MRQSARAVGLGMAGVGVILVVISLFLANAYWTLLTGPVLIVIGILLFLVLATGSPSDFPTDKKPINSPGQRSS